MSTHLLNAAVAHLRAGFTRAQVAELRSYGGEFNAAEVAATSYVCPAVLCTVLGWRPEPNSRRLSGRDVRTVRLAAFVAYKHANREKRLEGAALLAEQVCVLLRTWRPVDTDLPVQIGPLEAEPMAENMYGRAIDKHGQALWLVSWEQCVKPIAPLPELFDLLSIEIEDLTRQGDTPDPAPPAPGTLVVTEEIEFAPLPPA